MERGALEVVRGGSPSAWWEMAVRAPSPALSGLVRRYAGYREHAVEPVRRREVPSGDVQVILSFGPRIRLLEPAGGADPARREATSFVAGVGDTWAVTEYTGGQHGLQLTLTPVGAGMLLGVPMDGLAGSVVGLQDALGDRAARLIDQLAATDGWAARFDLLDAVLPAWFERGRPPAPAAVWAWRRLRQTDGRVTIASLVDELGCSHRYLVSAFREHIGVPPKTLARILRCQRAIRLLGGPGGRSLADVALAAGYYDQAHLARDFTRLTGLPPGRWAAEAAGAAPALEAAEPSG